MRRLLGLTSRLYRKPLYVVPAVLTVSLAQYSACSSEDSKTQKSDNRPSALTSAFSTTAPSLVADASFALPSGLTLLTPETTEPFLANSEKDVFLLVYAEWCAKCSGLKIIYEQVAAALTEVGSPVVVAMVDGSNYSPPGFTKDQQKMFPRLRFFPAKQASGQDDPRNFYFEPGLGADEMLRFIHARSISKFDLNAALAASSLLEDHTMKELRENIVQAIIRDEQSALQFRLMSMGPCAQNVRDAFLAWRLSQYYPEKDSAREKHMEIVQTCMSSKQNKDYWEQVQQLAKDQLKIADKSQRRQK